MVWIVLGYTFLQILLLIASASNKSKTYYVPVKILCSISFILTAFIFSVQSNNDVYFKSMLPALVLCLIGDIFMGLFNQFHKKRNIALGIVSFLLAHIAFVALLLQIQWNWSAWHVIIPNMGVGITVLISYLMKLHLGDLRMSIYIYSFFISLLFITSVFYMYSLGTATSICMGVGGILFFLSDFLLLFLYFYRFKNKNCRKVFHCMNLLTYYYGMFAFGLSVLYF